MSKPTVLGPVKNTATIAREEIFGPVLTILGDDTVDEAVAMANDTPYGWAAYVSGTDRDATRQVASRLRAGQVNINSVAPDLMAPFGGFKQSGKGRESFISPAAAGIVVGFGVHGYVLAIDGLLRQARATTA